MKVDALYGLADVDAQRPVLVVRADGNDRLCKTGIGHSRSGEKELAGEEYAVFHSWQHSDANINCP